MRQQSTLEQDIDASEMPICLMNLNEPKQRWADPSEAKLYVCSIPNIKIFLAVVDWSRTRKLVSFIPYNKQINNNYNYTLSVNSMFPFQLWASTTKWKLRSSGSCCRSCWCCDARSRLSSPTSQRRRLPPKSRKLEKGRRDKSTKSTMLLQKDLFEEDCNLMKKL